MAANPIIDMLGGNANTTSASIVTLITVTPPGNDLAIKVHWNAVGIETVSKQIATYEAIASFKNVSGTMSQVSTTSVLHDVDEDTNVVFSEAVSGNTILLRVTPAVDTTNWSAWATITYLQV